MVNVDCFDLSFFFFYDGEMGQRAISLLSSTCAVFEVFGLGAVVVFIFFHFTRGGLGPLLTVPYFVCGSHPFPHSVISTQYFWRSVQCM